VTKILVLGLDCAAPEILLGRDDLPHFRQLMEVGCFGRLESVIPPITVPAWMCMATSQDPGSLGVYGFRNRIDHSYAGLGIANSKSIQELAIWDQVAREGKRACIIGVPPNYPPRKTSGLSVGCFLTPDTTKNVYTHPPHIGAEIQQLVGEYPVDVKGFRTERKDWLRDEIFAMSRKQFEVVRHYLKQGNWDYFQFVDIGLDRVHHGFWSYYDTQHRHYMPGNPYESVIPDYYRHLDAELGKILELLDGETALLVVSDHGAQRLDGGFCVNEWLVQQGLLVLNEYPSQVTAFDKLNVDWDRTKVWSEGGYYARVFMNIKGREPQGIIEPADYEQFRNELKQKFLALPDDRGQPMESLVFTPQEVYKNIRNVAPDLIVHFGGLYWRSIGSVGHSSLYLQENDTGPDDCNHAQFGAFILAAPNCPLRGELTGAHLLDVAPTLLELGGYDPLPAQQGQSWLTRFANQSDPRAEGSAEDEEIVRQRLSGLGYIS